jgi:hypothetical protein
MSELPRNAGYLIAAYAIAAGIFLGNYVRLRRRAVRTDKTVGTVR